MILLQPGRTPAGGPRGHAQKECGGKTEWVRNDGPGVASW